MGGPVVMTVRAWWLAGAEQGGSLSTMPLGSPPQGRAPEREESGHAPQNNERFAEVVSWPVGAKVQISADGEQGGPKDKGGG